MNRHLVFIPAVLLLLATAPMVSSVPGIRTQDEGTTLGQSTIINCSGAGITCTRSGSTTTLTVTGGGASGYQTVMDHGSSLTQRTLLNFEGAGVSCTDYIPGLNTTCTVAGGPPPDAGYVIISGQSTGSTNERALSAGNYTTVNTTTGGAVKIDWAHGLTCSAGQAVTSASTSTLSCTSTITASDVACGSQCVGVGEMVATGTPSATTYLRGDGTWSTPTGGGGSPAGNQGTLQFNSAGAFAGITSAAASTDSNYLWLLNTTDPTITPDGGVFVFSEHRANQSVVAFQNNINNDVYVEPSMMFHQVAYTTFTGASAGKTDVGWATTAVGTAAVTTFATTNLSTSIQRATYSTGATASTPTEIRVSSALPYWRGNGATVGGFFCKFAWTNPTHNAASDKMLVGMTASTAAIAGTVVPSANLNVIYAGWDAAAAAIQLCGNDGTGTATCTACSATDFPINSTTNVYALYISAPSSAAGVNLELRRLDNSAVTPCAVTITAAADMPANTTFLTPRIWMSNGTTAANAAIGYVKMYCMSDKG